MRLRKMAGSPPHAWGIRYKLARRSVPARFTPTRVGNTPSRRSCAAAMSVHPHTRGEYAARVAACSVAHAVHPHTRGEYRRACSTRSAASGSPPHAWGIRRRSCRRPCRKSVHPHTRGEYWPTPTHRLRRPPVHPHTRGEYGGICATRDGRRRFTPTRVGNTLFTLPSDRHVVGSPPHAWGIRHVAWRRYAHARFTPTRVGNTAATRATVSGIAVHPHTRGEYVVANCQRRPREVHPHTRGEYGHDGQDALLPRRFTPTRVGNTYGSAWETLEAYGSPPHAWGIRPRCESSPLPPPVHPHTRGEYLVLLVHLTPLSRFTPTRVGNT